MADECFRQPKGTCMEDLVVRLMHLKQGILSLSHT